MMPTIMMMTMMMMMMMMMVVMMIKMMIVFLRSDKPKNLDTLRAGFEPGRSLSFDTIESRCSRVIIPVQQDLPG